MRLSAFAGVAFLAAAPALAQGQAEATTDTRQAMSVSATVSQAYDDDVPYDVAGVIDPTGENLGGHSTIFTAGMNYSWQMGKVRAGTTADTSARYYSKFEQFRAMNHSGGIGLTTALSRRTSLFVNQTAQYSPSYLYPLFPQSFASSPGAAPPVEPNYLDGDLESMSYGTSVTLTQRLTRQTGVTVGAETTTTRFTESSASHRNLRTYGFSGRFTRNMTRNTSMHAGYRYRDGDFGYGALFLTADKYREHTVDIGAALSRPLSATQRVTLSASIGASLINLPDEAVSFQGLDDNSHRNLTAQFSADYPLSRTWGVHANYRRGVEYVAGLSEPLLTQGAFASVSGTMIRKLELTITAGYSNGDSEFNVNRLLLETYTGSARLGYRFGRHITAFGEYLYYIYDFRESAEVPSTFPLGLERQGIRGGLSVRFPILPR